MNAFEVINLIIQQLGLKFRSEPILVMIFVFYVLMNIMGRKLGKERGLAYGVDRQRGAGVVNPPALNAFQLNGCLRTVLGRLFKLSLYFLVVVYISWVWGIMYSNMPSFMNNPFENMHEFIRAVGVGMMNQPWLALLLVIVFLSEVAGRIVGWNRGVEEGIKLQIHPAVVPPPGTFGEAWRNKRWERRLFQITFSWSLLLLTLIYLGWLWGIQIIL